MVSFICWGWLAGAALEGEGRGLGDTGYAVKCALAADMGVAREVGEGTHLVVELT